MRVEQIFRFVWLCRRAPAIWVAAAVAWTAGCSASSSSSSAPADAAAAMNTNEEAGSSLYTGGSSGASSPNDATAFALDAGDAGATCAGDGGPGTFTCTGPLSVPRDVPAGAALPNGTILVAGGWNESGVLTSAETYDPATGIFTPAGTMQGGHLWGGWGTPLPLLPNGKVLVAGGLDANGQLSPTAELYDPSSRSFAATGAMSTPAISMSPVLLDDGSVLFVGGWDAVTASTAAELPGWSYTGSGTSAVQRYDPTSGEFRATGSLAESRLFGCNALLTGGVLAIAGAQGPAEVEHNIELYDPDGGGWTTVASFTGAAFCANAFALRSGQVLLTGTGGLTGATLPVPGVQLFDPTSNAIGPTMNALANYSPTFVQLANDDVLAFGGTLNGVPTVTAQVYSASTNAWRTVGNLNQPRAGAVGAFPLPSGEVLVVGGTDENGAPLATAEIYHP